VERPYRLGGRNAVLRALAFRNRMNAGGFRDALALGAPSGAVPDVTLVRMDRTKQGFGLSTQVEITPQVGGYVRAGWNDGKTETYAFTEIDRSLAAGLLVKGNAWKRENDSAGIAGYLNGLSREHREYLAAGGQGFFLGDGRLSYGLEQIFEVFYSLGVARGARLTADLQHLVNPGYNRDRGPARVFSLRAHFEL
jgi:carbohydrate-selective porin OprB